MPTPADLLEAIVAHLVADATVTAALTGGVWADAAPPDAPPPLLTIADISETADYQSVDGGGSIPLNDTAEIQLNVYATSKADARAFMRLVETSLNDAPLTITTGTVLYLRRRGRPHGLKDPDLGPGGGDVWMQAVSFDAVVSRTL